MRDLPPSVPAYLDEARARLAVLDGMDWETRRQTLVAANRAAFERECRAAGVDPATATISPYLARTVQGWVDVMAANRAEAEERAAAEARPPEPAPFDDTIPEEAA